MGRVSLRVSNDNFSARILLRSFRVGLCFERLDSFLV